MAESLCNCSAIFNQMNIAECYRVLGLKVGASLDEVKASYRYLARQYHPDVNQEDPQSHEKFIKLNQAYQFLLTLAKPKTQESKQPTQTSSSTPHSKENKSPVTRVKTQEPEFRNNPQLTDVEKLLKQRSYLQLQQLLKDNRFPRAVALLEALVQRVPHDPEVRQWQAIAYQRWGRHMIFEGQVEKARIYLKKALRTDPQNRSLWIEVERDFRRMEQIVR